MDINASLPESRLGNDGDELLRGEGRFDREVYLRFRNFQSPEGRVLRECERAGPAFKSFEDDRSELSPAARRINDNYPAPATLPIAFDIKEVISRDLIAVVELRRNPVPGDTLIGETLAFVLTAPPELVIVPAAAFLYLRGLTVQQDTAFHPAARDEVIEHPLTLDASRHAVVAMANRRRQRVEYELATDLTLIAEKPQFVSSITQFAKAVAAEIKV